jgi:hypothetical protein
MDIFCQAIIDDAGEEPAWSADDVTTARELIRGVVNTGLHATSTEYKSNRWNAFYKTARAVDQRWSIMSIPQGGLPGAHTSPHTPTHVLCFFF